MRRRQLFINGVSMGMFTGTYYFDFISKLGKNQVVLDLCFETASNKGLLELLSNGPNKRFLEKSVI